MGEITDSLRHYFVQIFVVTKYKTPPSLEFIGSGTLVEVEGTHYILTAAHVWNETKDADEIGLGLTTYPSAFSMRRGTICPYELWNGEISEWGPDLALLKLGLPYCSTIGAHKSFVNLVSQRETFSAYPPNIGTGLWAFIGMVGELSDVQIDQKALTKQYNTEVRAFFGGILETHHREGFDYFDLGVNLGLPGVPTSFGGVSGGGLWEINLSRNKSGKISWDRKPRFRGVPFWQSEVSGDQRFIRCHGPQSIFKMAWKSWDLHWGN